MQIWCQTGDPKPASNRGSCSGQKQGVKTPVFASDTGSRGRQTRGRRQTRGHAAVKHWSKHPTGQNAANGKSRAEVVQAEPRAEDVGQKAVQRRSKWSKSGQKEVRRGPTSGVKQRVKTASKSGPKTAAGGAPEPPPGAPYPSFDRHLTIN